MAGTQNTVKQPDSKQIEGVKVIYDKYSYL